MSNTWIIAHFSPTGTTVKVARAIAEGSGCPVQEIDLSRPVSPEVLGKGDLLLVAMPVYGGLVPAIALERLAALQGSGQKAVAVAVYGNRAYDNALLQMKDELEANGYQVIAAGAFIAEHSIARTIAAGRPDANDLMCAASFGAEIMKKLAQGALAPIQVPGDPAYKEQAHRGGSPVHPSAEQGCVGCGVCAKNCPVGAISAEALTKAGDPCINCMRCVAMCPQKVRSLPAERVAAATAMLMEKASEPKQPALFV